MAEILDVRMPEELQTHILQEVRTVDLLAVGRTSLQHFLAKLQQFPAITAGRDYFATALDLGKHQVTGTLAQFDERVDERDTRPRI